MGRLDGIGRLLPGPDELLHSYVRKEAVLSSQIEGTQSSLADLLLHESSAAPGAPLDDVREVSNYIGALNHGVELLETLPLSLRLIRELHRSLVSGTRGAHQAPGEFRRSQNWIGGTMPGNAYFVPPPAHEVMPALDKFEKFLHNAELPALLKAGLVHVQFETIHPFLDGNGRVGRMLIPLVLVAEGALERPWLYVSLHFKRNRSQYYDLLQRVRTHGAWEDWIAFYLDGIAAVAEQATSTIRKLLALFKRDRAAVEASRVGSTYQRVAERGDVKQAPPDMKLVPTIGLRPSAAQFNVVPRASWKGAQAGTGGLPNPQASCASHALASRRAAGRGNLRLTRRVVENSNRVRRETRGGL